jgi:hypothetical protein
VHTNHTPLASFWPDSPICPPITLPPGQRIEWVDLVEVEPVLADVERLIRGSHPPQDAAEFWSLWSVLEVRIRDMLADSPLSMAERQRVKEHCIRVLDDTAEQLAGTWNRYVCLPPRDDRGRGVVFEE